MAYQLNYQQTFSDPQVFTDGGTDQEYLNQSYKNIIKEQQSLISAYQTHYDKLYTKYTELKHGRYKQKKNEVELLKHQVARTDSLQLKYDHLKARYREDVQKLTTQNAQMLASLKKLQQEAQENASSVMKNKSVHLKVQLYEKINDLAHRKGAFQEQ